MPTAADDFRIFWDDAYRWHHLTSEKIATPAIIELCERVGMLIDARVGIHFESNFGECGRDSTRCLRRERQIVASHVSIQTIRPDKLNQLRHVEFFKKTSPLDRYMERHRALLKPRFDCVEDVFPAQGAHIEGVRWTRPKGGYFINLVTPPGLASRTVALAQTAGLILTPAGASFPYRRDPRDEHIRTVPSFPGIDEIQMAASGIALALKQAIAGRRIGNRE